MHKSCYIGFNYRGMEFTEEKNTILQGRCFGDTVEGLLSRFMFSVEERTREGYRWGRQGRGISSIKIIPIESVKNIQIYFFDILSIRLP